MEMVLLFFSLQEKKYHFPSIIAYICKKDKLSCEVSSKKRFMTSLYECKVETKKGKCDINFASFSASFSKQVINQLDAENKTIIIYKVNEINIFKFTE